MWSLILYVVSRSMYVVCSMYVVFCKIAHCIHIHWCIVMGLGHNDPWVVTHVTLTDMGSKVIHLGVNDLWFKFLEKRVSIFTYFDVFSSLILQWLQKYVIAKAGETCGSRATLFTWQIAKENHMNCDIWFEKDLAPVLKYYPTPLQNPSYLNSWYPS